MPTLGMITPILRMFDEDKARQFYIDFLGFQVDWEHRFEEDFPLYMQISLNQSIIHLSEHHGDSSPGSTIRIHVEGLEEYHQQLLAQNYKYARPGLETTPWNTREVSVGDPFGNKLVFYEPVISE